MNRRHAPPAWGYGGRPPEDNSLDLTGKELRA
jgi:hypothetical protein